ncbi:MAG: class I SAM-dependent methyltransferase [bacterium]|nr:class I SAM-dependent methyltransferase [bacterium]
MAHRSHQTTGQELRSGRDLYRLAAPIYDACTYLWSGRAIWDSRRCQVQRMRPGSRALYAGSGQGRAAILAALTGVEVTCVDRSPAMLALAQKNADKAGVTLTFVQADIFDWEPDRPFDHVVANHFFNVFPSGPMRVIRERLIGFLAPGGTLHVADFRPPHGNALARSLQRLHHIIPLSGCAALTRNAIHTIYDHGAELEELGLHAEEVIDHRVWDIGPAWYRTWFFGRKA